MDIRNIGRQQGLIAVVPNWEREGQDLNQTGAMACRRPCSSLQNAISSPRGITFRLIDLIYGHKELSRSPNKVRDTAAELARRTKIVRGRILNIGESSEGKANDCS